MNLNKTGVLGFSLKKERTYIRGGASLSDAVRELSLASHQQQGQKIRERFFPAPHRLSTHISHWG